MWGWIRNEKACIIVQTQSTNLPLNANTDSPDTLTSNFLALFQAWDSSNKSIWEHESLQMLLLWCTLKWDVFRLFHAVTILRLQFNTNFALCLRIIIRFSELETTVHKNPRPLDRTKVLCCIQCLVRGFYHSVNCIGSPQGEQSPFVLEDKGLPKTKWCQYPCWYFACNSLNPFSMSNNVRFWCGFCTAVILKMG